MKVNPKTSNTQNARKIIALDEKGEVLREFRKLLHDASVLGQALTILGKRESVEKEVILFSQRFV